MRPLFLFFLLLISVQSFGQIQRFSIQAKVINQDGEPISDVYIINLVTLEKDISHSDGVFTISVLPTDSIILSHISYFRKVVTIHSILLDPIITMYSEEVDIPEIRVLPEHQTDIERANKNMQFINEYEVLPKQRIQEEQTNPVQATMVEQNDLLRSEASSISLVRFSPSENVGKLFTKLKKKDRSNEYSHTKKLPKDYEKALEENKEP